MRDKIWAQNMFKLCLDADGRLDEKRLSALCEYASKNFPNDKALKILRALRKLAGVKIAGDSALVESAAPLSAEAKRRIEGFVKSKNPKASAEFAENPELIAGFRIKIGDSVWENSARRKLRDLAESLGA